MAGKGQNLIRPVVDNRQNAFNPLTGKQIPLGPSPFKRLFVVEQLSEDILLCLDEYKQLVSVALPLSLQKATYARTDESAFVDGLYYKWLTTLTKSDSNDLEYSWQSVRTRATVPAALATEDQDSDYVFEEERITPPYRKGEPIIAMHFINDREGSIRYMDSNTAGRSFVKEVKLTVKELFFVDLTLGSNSIIATAKDSTVHIEVALPWVFRRESYENATRSGITYAVSSNLTDDRIYRVAKYSDAGIPMEEDQVTTPPYYVGEPIIVSEYVDPVDDYITHVDLNVAGRCWAAIPENVEEIT